MSTKREKFIQKAVNVHGEKYDYSCVEYKSSHSKVQILCPKHGEFLQTPSQHLNSGGCKKCGVERRVKARTETTESFRSKARLVHGDVYDYSKVEYKNNHHPIIISCSTHGDFKQTPANHLSGKGCPKCASIKRGRGRRLTTPNFVERAKAIHNNRYDYSKASYVTAITPIKIICPDHGEFWQSPNAHLAGRGCDKCGGTFKESKEEFITHANKKFRGKFDYTHVDYKNKDSKVKIVCPKHGEFWTTPRRHIESETGCLLCSATNRGLANRKTNEEFIEQADSIFKEKYDYSFVQYQGAQTKVKIVCPKHGEFYITPDAHTNGGQGCPSCGMVMSTGEEEIFGFVKQTRDAKRGDRAIIHPYELDVYIPEKKIAIEFDGLYWHSTAIKPDTRYHLNKTEMCEERGIRLIHIYEDEWRDKKERVKAFLKTTIGDSDDIPVYARKTTVGGVQQKQYHDFLATNHIQGATNSSVRIGLFHDNNLVAVMGLAKNKEGWNLNRFATKGRVVGGFTKLLTHFKRNYEWSRIISYADRRWSQGNVYKTCGFTLTKKSPPSFDYVKNGTRFNRQNFMKHKIKDKLPFFDPSLTEKENMEHNGFYQIWNCGYLKFEMKNKGDL